MFYKKVNYLRKRFKRLMLRARRLIGAMKIKWKYALLCTAALLIGGAALIIALSAGSGPVPASSERLEVAKADAYTPMPTLAPTTTPEPSLPPTPTPDPTLMKDCEDSERVAELQLRLMKLGYMDNDEPTEHFGPVTEHAVQMFQRQHDLQQDGIAGPVTLELIFSDEAKKYTLLEGTYGDDVSSFQSQLKDLGYLSKTTGYYGDETVAAVKEFQKTNGLSADGKAGQYTIDRINSDKAKASPGKVREKRKKANIDKMIAVAKQKVGSKYRLGNTGPNTFDCSGFVYYCLKQAGSNRRRLTSSGYAQVGDWEKITSTSKLKKGDLLFFLNNARTQIGHVGIYIGGGQMIDASSGNGKVVRRTISSNYWKKHFKHALRPW